MPIKTSLIILFTVFLSACSGYQFVENDNPLAIHGIRSLSVPMFVNKTPVPNVGSMVTKEISFLLSSYPGLKVRSGEDLSSDAILIGIVESTQQLAELIQTTERQFTTSDLKASLGSRKEFFVPTGSSLNLSVRFIMIKNPRRQDVELAKSELNKMMINHPKMLMNQSLNFVASFTRVVAGTETIDSAGLVNMTKNKAIMERALQDGSKSLAQQFKDVVLNAF